MRAGRRPIGRGCSANVRIRLADLCCSARVLLFTVRDGAVGQKSYQSARLETAGTYDDDVVVRPLIKDPRGETASPARSRGDTPDKSISAQKHAFGTVFNDVERVQHVARHGPAAVVRSRSEGRRGRVETVSVNINGDKILESQRTVNVHVASTMSSHDGRDGHEFE